MELLRRVLSRLRALFRGQAIEGDMDREMRFHVEQLAQEYQQSGMTAVDAHAAAVRRFGNLTQLKERGRDIRGAGLLEELRQDLQYGLRMLRRTPGFTAVALLALALGIGVNTAIFSIANGLFFRSAPESAGALVRLYGVRDSGEATDSFSYANYKDIREQSRSFQALAAHQYVSVGMSFGDDEPKDIPGEIVSANYFSVFGVNPLAGRTFATEEDIVEEPRLVAVVAEAFARTHAGTGSNPVGRQVYINGSTFEIIGVVPDSFRGTYAAFKTEMWFPLSAMAKVRPRNILLTNRGWGWLFGTGRLKPGIAVSQASTELQQIAAQLEKDYPGPNRGLRMAIVAASNLPDQFKANASRFLLFFMCAAAAVLLITGANIAGMMLARATARGREVAIRQSLGAGRFRLIRQWITESLLLSVMGGGLGFILTFWLRQGLLGFAPPDWNNFAPDLSLDWHVVTFALALTLLTGFLFGLAPAFQATRVSVVSGLKSDGVLSLSGHRSRFHGFVVSLQVTLSLVLMIVSGLLYRSLQTSESFRPGFDSEKLVVAEFDLGRYGYQPEVRRDLSNRLTSALRGLPNVAGVARASIAMLGTNRESMGYEIEGYQPPNGKKTVSIANDFVAPEYFGTVGIPIVEGRSFDPALLDAPIPTEAVVNQTMARKFWPNESAIGKTIRLDGSRLRIVGVAHTIPYYELGEAPQPYIYLPAPQAVGMGLMLMVRASGNAESILPGVRQAVRAVDPKISLNGVTTFRELRRGPLFPTRALLAVAGSFGLLALLLTLTGVYGVISYSVTRRTREFGIRIALGARRTSVFRMVIREGLQLAAIGIAAGIVAAVLCTRFLSSLLFGVSATDPLTYGMISALMIVTAMLACYVPARRATRVDPIVALRQDG